LSTFYKYDGTIQVIPVRFQLWT